MLVGYTAFLNPFSAKDMVVNYILLPVSVVFFVGYKLWKGTKWVKLEEMDLYSGRRDQDEEATFAEGEKKSPWWMSVRRVLVG